MGISPQLQKVLIDLGRHALQDGKKIQPKAACISAAQEWCQQHKAELQSLSAIAQRAKLLLPDSTAARDQFMKELNSDIDLQYFLIANPNSPSRMIQGIIELGMENTTQFIVMYRMLQDLA